MLLFQMENKSPGDFSLICLPFAHHAMEICSLSVCLQRNKWKLSFCQRTKQTKRSCPSICTCTYLTPLYVVYPMVDLTPMCCVVVLREK